MSRSRTVATAPLVTASCSLVTLGLAFAAMYIHFGTITFDLSYHPPPPGGPGHEPLTLTLAVAGVESQKYGQCAPPASVSSSYGHATRSCHAAWIGSVVVFFLSKTALLLSVRIRGYKRFRLAIMFFSACAIIGGAVVVLCFVLTVAFTAKAFADFTMPPLGCTDTQAFNPGVATTGVVVHKALSGGFFFAVLCAVVSPAAPILAAIAMWKKPTLCGPSAPAAEAHTDSEMAAAQQPMIAPRSAAAAAIPTVGATGNVSLYAAPSAPPRPGMACIGGQVQGGVVYVQGPPQGPPVQSQAQAFGVMPHVAPVPQQAMLVQPYSAATAQPPMTYAAQSGQPSAAPPMAYPVLMQPAVPTGPPQARQVTAALAFVPSDESIAHLVGMGFAQVDVVRALKETRGNQELSLTLLCNE